MRRGIGENAIEIGGRVARQSYSICEPEAARCVGVGKCVAPGESGIGTIDDLRNEHIGSLAQVACIVGRTIRGLAVERIKALAHNWCAPRCAGVAAPSTDTHLVRICHIESVHQEDSAVGNIVRVGESNLSKSSKIHVRCGPLHPEIRNGHFRTRLCIDASD